MAKLIYIFLVAACSTGAYAKMGAKSSVELEKRNEFTFMQSTSLSSGTCYDMSNCQGNSVHVNERFSCPVGTASFKGDLGTSTCENF